MARLTDVFMGGEYDYQELKHRRVPIFIDDSVTMIMQMDEDFLIGNGFQEPTKAELREFGKKLQILPLDELEQSLKVSAEEFLNILNQMVPCIGCRRSAENLYRNVKEFQFPAFYPMYIDTEGSLRLCKQRLKCKFLCTVFNQPRGLVQQLLDSLAKFKPGRRCTLHSIDSHRVRTVGCWIDIWEYMDIECQEEITVIEIGFLLETLQRYLTKHRFCDECKAKVLKAYHILVEEVDGNQESGYVPAVYKGLTCLRDINHLQLCASTDFVSRLIAKAVPEIVGTYGGAKEQRHAKTMEIAQEEVLTCIGICLFEKLNRIHQRFREEQHTWEILMCAGIRALRRQFDVLLEKKLGVSQLELFCEELNKEEQLKRQKLESKKQRRRRKKEKKFEEISQDENHDPKNLPVKEEVSFEECIDEDKEGLSLHCCEEESLTATVGKKKKKKSGKGKAKHDSKDVSLARIERNTHSKLLFPNSGMPCQTPESSSDTPPDCGYSSENVIEMTSSASSEGSDIACSEGYCHHSVGDCMSLMSNASGRKGCDDDKNSRSHPRSTAFLPLPYRSLEEQLEDEWSTEEEDPCIPEEQVSLVRSRGWSEKRAEFRKHLLMEFTTLLGINIPPPQPTKHNETCPHHPNSKSRYLCLGDEENVPTSDEIFGSDVKDINKSQLCRPSGSNKPRAGSGGQGSRRYKGKNRR